MLTPICVPCRVEMRCSKNNRLVCDPDVPGVGGSTYWLGDEWRCPGCGARIVTGFGKPLVHHPGPDYGEALEFWYELPAEVKA